MGKNEIGKIFGTVKGPGGQEYLAVEMDVDRYHNKGVKYLDVKKYERAAEMFEKEIECEPSNDIGYHFLGKTLQAMGRKEEAKKNYQIALKKAEEMDRRYPGDVDKEVFEEIREDLKSLEAEEDPASV